MNIITAGESTDIAVEEEETLELKYNKLLAEHEALIAKYEVYFYAFLQGNWIFCQYSVMMWLVKG